MDQVKTFLGNIIHVDMVDMVDMVLAAGIDVNWSRELNGWSGLHYAAWYDFGELLDLLLAQAGVDVNNTDINNLTPLMMACAKGHENVVRRLCLVSGIDICCREAVYGRNALHVAVSRDQVSSTLLYCTLLCCTVLYCIVLNCTVLCPGWLCQGPGGAGG